MIKVAPLIKDSKSLEILSNCGLFIKNLSVMPWILTESPTGLLG